MAKKDEKKGKKTEKEKNKTEKKAAEKKEDLNPIPYFRNGQKAIRAPYFAPLPPRDHIPLRQHYHDGLLSK